MKSVIAVLGLLFAASASANVRGSTVTTLGLSSSSPAHYVDVCLPSSAAAAGNIIGRVTYSYPGGGRLVDIIAVQVGPGVGGTSWSLDVRNSAATSLLTTTLTATLASGANQSTNAKGTVALPSGWTRPVIKSDSTPVVAQGAWIDLYTTESGTYSTHASIVICLVFEPLQ